MRSEVTITPDRAFKPLLTSELKILAPSIFTDHPSSRTSKHYTYTPTVKIIEDLEQSGWFPSRAQERRAKKFDNSGFKPDKAIFRMLAFSSFIAASIIALHSNCSCF